MKDKDIIKPLRLHQQINTHGIRQHAEKILIGFVFQMKQFFDLADPVTDSVLMTMENFCSLRNIAATQYKTLHGVEIFRPYKERRDIPFNESTHGMGILLRDQKLVCTQTAVVTQIPLFCIGSKIGVIAFAETKIQFLIGTMDFATADKKVRHVF